MKLNLFASKIESEVKTYCESHDMHPESAKLMLKVARNLPRNTSCSAQDIATNLGIGYVDESNSQDSIYGSRSANR